MVQDQLADYISSQMKLGISRDAIKAALTGAGWQPTDIEDTLKKVESGKMAAQPASVSSSPKPTVMTTTVSSTTVSTSKSEPKSIKVSDLVSAPDSSPAFFAATSAGSKSSSKNSSMNMGSEYLPKKRGGSMVLVVVCVIIILALAGFAAYLYSQNASLNSKVTSLGNTSSGIATKLSSLNTQVQAMNASNTALMAQVATLTVANQDLQTNLSFVAAPPGTTTATPSSTVSISGTLSGGGKSPYVLLTQYGVKAVVANSKDASVIAALQPIVASTSTPTSSTELIGSHFPGSPDITVTAVNGAPL